MMITAGPMFICDQHWFSVICELGQRIIVVCYSVYSFESYSCSEFV